MGWQDAPLDDAAQPPRGGGSWRDAPLDPSSLTWGEWARNLVTGEHTTEFPDAEEFISAYLGRANATGAQGAGGVTLAQLTPDPKAQLDILRRHVQGLEDRTDRFGNVMVRAPQSGITEWAYLNRPGASMGDLAEIGAQTVATLPLGPLFGLGRTLTRRIATGAVAGAGGSVGLDLAAGAAGSEQGVDPLRATVSGVVGGVLGPLVPRSNRQLPPTVGQETVLAAERLNEGALSNTGARVDVPRTMASDSRAIQMLGASTQGLPFGSPLARSADRLRGGLGEAAEQTAAGYGGAREVSHAGDAAREGMLDWVRRGSRAVDRRLYDRAYNLVPANTMTRIPETRSLIQTLENEMQASAGQASRGVVNLLQEALNRPNGLTFGGVRDLRTEIGARLDGHITPEAGTNMPALRRAYDALSIDMRNAALHGGGNAASAAINRADRVHRLIVARRETVERVIGMQGDAAPGLIFDRIIGMAQNGSRGDLQRLVQARQAMGAEAWNEVAAAAIRRFGQGQGGEFSPARFVSAYEKLTPSGRHMLFDSTYAGSGGLRQALDDIATVSRRYQATMSRYANPSGTARAATVAGGIGVAVASPWHALTGVAGGYGLAWLLSRPVTARAVARYLHAASQPGQAGALLREQALRQVTEAMRAEQGRERQ